MMNGDLELEVQLSSIEERARSARKLSIALTVIPILAAALFLFITIRQVQTKQVELTLKQAELNKRENELEQRDRELLEKEGRLVVLDKTVEQLPPKVFDAALKKSKYNPPIVESVPETNQYIRTIDITTISPKELKANVQYTYDGSEGTRTVVVVASALQSSGLQIPGTSYGAALVKTGAGRVTVTVEKTGNSEPYTSSRLRVCMQVAGGKVIACKSVDYSMEWR